MTNHNSKRNADNIVIECPKIAQREYKRSIHWEFYRGNGIHVKSKWYKHQSEAVIENYSCKILWDSAVQTDHFITARRSGMKKAP